MKELFNRLNIEPKNIELYNLAFTHSSYVNEKHEKDDYERLEYLGDAVLELLMSEYLYKNTEVQEGEMTKLRANYVCENALYEYSKEIDLSSYILLGNGMDKPNKTIIADSFEACMAVIYIENGLDAVKKIFNDLIVPYIERHEDFLMDYKSLLQESVQTVKKSVEYVLVNESGPAHKRLFEVEVVIDGLVYGKATGNSKKEAEQNAAKEAYMKRAN